MKRTGVNQGSASGHTPETGAFLPSQPGLCSEKKPCLEKGCSVRAARLAHTPFLGVFFYLFIYLFWCLFLQGWASGWQRGFCCGATWFTMAPLWGWQLCFVFPGEITPSSALQRQTVQNYAASEWKQSWDCSGIQVMPPYWYSAAAAIKHAPNLRDSPQKALIL